MTPAIAGVLGELADAAEALTTDWDMSSRETCDRFDAALAAARAALSRSAVMHVCGSTDPDHKCCGYEPEGCCGYGRGGDS